MASDSVMLESSTALKDLAFCSTSFLGPVTLSIREECLMTSNPLTLARSKKISRKRLSMDEDIISRVHRCGKSVVLTHRKSNLTWLSNKYIDILCRGIIFETFASEGAILIMPDGGTAEDLLNHNLLRKYIAKHAKSWYNYIREVRGREVKNGDIRLVIGFDKVSSWGIATFAKNVEERVRLEFRTIDSDQPASRTYVWNCVGGGSGRVGPQEEEMDELAMSNSASETSIKNQTIFVRTLNFNLKGKTWNDLTCHKIRSSDHSSSNSGSRSNQRPSGPSGGWSSSGSEESHSDQGSVNFEATQFGLSVCRFFSYYT